MTSTNCIKFFQTNKTQQNKQLNPNGSLMASYKINFI